MSHTSSNNEWWKFKKEASSICETIYELYMGYIKNTTCFSHSVLEGGENDRGDIRDTTK
jgi:hypothetical protein